MQSYKKHFKIKFEIVYEVEKGAMIITCVFMPVFMPHHSTEGRTSRHSYGANTTTVNKSPDLTFVSAGIHSYDEEMDMHS